MSIESLTAASGDLTNTRSDGIEPATAQRGPVPLEMDTISPLNSPVRYSTRLADSMSRSRSRAKSPMRPVLNRREYAVGIVLLLVVVFLWTSSNFVTQVSLACLGVCEWMAYGYGSEGCDVMGWAWGIGFVCGRV